MIEAFIESHGEDDRADRILLIDIEKNCFACRHLHEDERTCDAFPGGIPPEYLYLERTHERHCAGDHGITFDPVEKPRKIDGGSEG
ncbi:MAG: hypothetical protein HQ559_03650 [Lentisphaerae bacterium]|nr:hypothetical protein [Lentisphaerota bacterium]